MCHKLSAQNKVWMPYVFPEKNPFFSKFADGRQQQDILAIVDLIGNVNLSADSKVKFAEEIYYYKKELFFNGNIYFDLGESETYLNSLLKKLSSKSQANTIEPHVYLGRSSEANAYSLFDGTIVFNVGLLAKMQTEDQIVQVLAHELAHYVHKDVLKNYSLFRNSNKKDMIKKYLNIAHYSRIFETKADSLSFTLTHNAGYNLIDCYQTFDLFTKSDEIHKKNNAERLELTYNDTINKIIENLRSHPQAESRKKNARQFVETCSKKNESFFDSKLQELVLLAKYEELHLLVENQNYSSCTLMSFSYHLQHADDPVFLYFLLESMRREILTEPSVTNGLFLAESLPFLNSDPNFVFLNPEIIGVKPNSREHQLLSVYKTNIQTYKKAILFFSGLSDNYEYPELLFSKALLFYNDPVKRKEYLKKYTSHREIRFPILAKDIEAESLNWFGSAAQNVYLCSDMSFYKGERYEFDPYSKEYKELRFSYLSNLENNLKKRDAAANYLFMDTLLYLNLNSRDVFFQIYGSFDFIHTYYKLKKNSREGHVEEIVFDQTEKKINKNESSDEFYITPNLYFLFPTAYELFKLNRFNSITYINLISYNHQYQITTDRLSDSNSFKQEYWDLSKINSNKLSKIIKKIVVLNTRSK
jgi:predicted SprT family Zn-dependent metalloprotease